MLSEIIIQKIEREGALSFHDYMELCLYHPELGYYNTVAEKIGNNGDFYTSPHLSASFGAMVGKQLEEMWQIMGEGPFTIVEFGAGSGKFCSDILSYCSTNRNFYDQIRYCIIEKSPSMRTIQKQHLKEKVCWYDSIEDIGSINGCIVSNELLDNFSFHQVVMQESLMEVFVDYKDEFKEELRLAEADLCNYFEEQEVALPMNFRTEINLEAITWLKTIAASLKKGYVLTIDYGYMAAELYHQRRNQGTVLCYHKHNTICDPYLNIGKQDITAHVNFTALQKWGSNMGLQYCGCTNQASFLLNLGFKEHLLAHEPQDQDGLRHLKKLSFLTYTLLVDMGHTYKVLIQSKNMPTLTLSGLKQPYN